MQERLRSGWWAVSAARRGIQPDIEVPRTPSADSRSQSRRVRRRDFMFEILDGLMVQDELRTVQDRPENVGEGAPRILLRAAALDVRHQLGQLVRLWLAADAGQVQRLDLARGVQK